MRLGFLTSLGSCVAILIAVGLSRVPAAAQVPAGAAKTTSRTLPRTPWGHPDLQGIWSNGTITPLERPRELAGKPVLTSNEADEFEKQTLQRADADRRDGAPAADVGRAYNEFWFDRGAVVETKRTSLMVDPPDGRVPPLTGEATKREPHVQKLAVPARPTHGRTEPCPSVAC